MDANCVRLYSRDIFLLYFVLGGKVSGGRQASVTVCILNEFKFQSTGW